MFKRKAFDKLLKWKKLNGSYIALLERSRRVVKSTSAEGFAKKNINHT